VKNSIIQTPRLQSKSIRKEKTAGIGAFIILHNRPMDAPKNTLGAGSKTQNANPSKVKQPVMSEEINKGTAMM
jgi:hypothetical protein